MTILISSRQLLLDSVKYNRKCMRENLLQIAIGLFNRFVSSEVLKRHSFQVARCMEYYANVFQQDPELWFTTGLVHDIDYDIARGTEPPDGHPYKGVQILRENQFPVEILDAVLGHAYYTNTPRKSLLAKTLFAVDELSGFLNSCARIHPSKSFEALNYEFVHKRMKEKSFSKNICREHLRQASFELGVEFEKHVNNCIKALSTRGAFDELFQNGESQCEKNQPEQQ